MKRIEMNLARMVLLAACVTLAGWQQAAPGADQLPGWKEVRRIRAPEATQAATADDRYVYAIANGVVAKYDRATGERLSGSTGAASHLNTGFFLDGKMYCAHSNFPEKPERSEIRILDPEKMVLETFKDFGASEEV